jgi:hypothetical protein
MNHYLYKIINRENGKFYIGVHSCKGDYYDSRYWGSGCFRHDARKNPDKYLRVLICQAESRKEALELEALFVTQELVDDPMCYNLKTGGLGGTIHCAETKAKIGAASKGRTFSEESKAKMSASLKGKTHSEETKAKIGASGKGRTFSEETKVKMSASSKGKTHSAETKAKIGAASKGKTLSEEHKAKLSAAHMRNVQCPHCEKAGGARVMHRWHFDNCKSR